MKGLRFQINERQQLILALLAVLLLAISMLYCLGFASLVARRAWENVPPSWNGTQVPEEEIDLSPTAPTTATALPATESP